MWFNIVPLLKNSINQTLLSLIVFKEALLIQIFCLNFIKSQNTSQLFQLQLSEKRERERKTPLARRLERSKNKIKKPATRLQHLQICSTNTTRVSPPTFASNHQISKRSSSFHFRAVRYTRAGSRAVASGLSPGPYQFLLNVVIQNVSAIPVDTSREERCTKRREAIAIGYSRYRAPYRAAFTGWERHTSQTGIIVPGVQRRVHRTAPDATEQTVRGCIIENAPNTVFLAFRFPLFYLHFIFHFIALCHLVCVYSENVPCLNSSFIFAYQFILFYLFCSLLISRCASREKYEKSKWNFNGHTRYGIN